MTVDRETIAYYAECWAERLSRGHNAGSHAIHYGLDFDDQDVDAAKLRTNDHVLERLGLAATTACRLIDVGCGVGGTAIDLARRHARWQVVGLDATNASLELARAFAQAARVDSRVRFVECDYEAPPLAERFDGAYAVESMCHAHDRSSVVRAVARLLEPLAPFVVVDFVRTTAPLGPKAAEQYAVLRRGFAIADYYDEPLAEVIERSGFRAQTIVDLTPRVAKAVARSATRARELVTLTTRMRRHLDACVALDDLLSAGHLRYVSACAVRNVQ